MEKENIEYNDFWSSRASESLDVNLVVEMRFDGATDAGSQMTATETKFEIEHETVSLSLKTRRIEIP